MLRNPTLGHFSTDVKFSIGFFHKFLFSGVNSYFCMLKIVYLIMSEYTNYQRSATLSKMFNGLIFYRYGRAMIIRNDNGFDVPRAIAVGSDNRSHMVKAINFRPIKIKVLIFLEQ
jgi:hypothetical protein